MENNSYRININKWLPNSNTLSLLYSKMITLKKSTVEHIQNITLLHNQLPDVTDSDCLEALDNMTKELRNIIQSYQAICTAQTTLGTLQIIDNYKHNHLSSDIKRLMHVMVKFYYNFINDIIDDKNDEMLRKIFRVVDVFNTVIDLKNEINEPSINIFSNDCPSILDECNKNMSMMRILQVLAKNTAEEHCNTLVDCLLKIFQPCNEEKLKSPSSADEMSENSSVEIYRALTKNLTPPHTIPMQLTALTDVNYENHIKSNNIQSIRELVTSQRKHVKNFINQSKDITSSAFFDGNIFKRNFEGHLDISKHALEKISNYYRRISWAAASEKLEHVILWWSSEGIVTRYNHVVGVHDFLNWLHQFVEGKKNHVPTCIKLALLNLCDALGCHVTITCWDEIFRLAYIAAFENTSIPFSTEGTNTGHVFAEIFNLLVNLNNECEIGGEWMIGAPLMELALSEQIIILHRLDHSIHTMRLWASQESKSIAHTWDLETFFLIVKGDLGHCINELSHLKLADHTTGLTVDCATLNVQVYVCARMRSKLVSEVKANLLLLKKSSNLSIKILAKICRVICMANLHMCLPAASYWCKSGNDSIQNASASPYVEIYLDKVLLPVLEVIEDHEISNMVLRIMCEAWLDYIYLEQIKFTECGSYQLLADFAYVSQWITECSIISQNMKEHLLKNEVLRRCEGVGKLLLRHPGETINMKRRLGIVKVDGGSPESLGLERMPAEMYVPNQEQWLELRTGRSYKLCRCIE